MAAAPGLGGYFPPLIMGATYNAQDNSYFIGLMLLVVTALIAFVFTIVGVRTPPPTTAALKGTSGRQH